MILKAKCYNGMEKQELKALIAEYQQFVSMVQVMKRPVELEANGNYAIGRYQAFCVCVRQ